VAGRACQGHHLQIAVRVVVVGLREQKKAAPFGAALGGKRFCNAILREQSASSGGGERAGRLVGRSADHRCGAARLGRREPDVP